MRMANVARPARHARPVVRNSGAGPRAGRPLPELRPAPLAPCLAGRVAWHDITECIPASGVRRAAKNKAYNPICSGVLAPSCAVLCCCALG
jgi:hypothetical protein